jgi:hypothetical protein
MPAAPCACAATRRPRRWAVSKIERISSSVNWLGRLIGCFYSDTRFTSQVNADRKEVRFAIDSMPGDMDSNLYGAFAVK